MSRVCLLIGRVTQYHGCGGFRFDDGFRFRVGWTALRVLPGVVDTSSWIYSVIPTTGACVDA